jgi:hypothetical protein
MTRPIAAVSPMPIRRRAGVLMPPGLPRSTARRAAVRRGLAQGEARLFTAVPGALALHLTQASPNFMATQFPMTPREFATAWHFTAVPQPMAVPASMVGRRSTALRAFIMGWHPTAADSALPPRPMVVLRPTAAARISQLLISRWAAGMAAVRVEAPTVVAGISRWAAGMAAARVGAPTAVADLTVAAVRAVIMAEVAGRPVSAGSFFAAARRHRGDSR